MKNIIWTSYLKSLISQKYAYFNFIFISLSNHRDYYLKDSFSLLKYKIFVIIKRSGIHMFEDEKSIVTQNLHFNLSQRRTPHLAHT